jgi:hypothetical protein
VNNEAPELSSEARRIISEARGFDDPTPDDRARVKSRWLASVAALAGVSSLTEAARAAGGVGWGIKAVGATLALVAGAIGLYVALPSESGREPHATPPPAWAGETHERFQKSPSGAREAASTPSTQGRGPSAVAFAKPAVSSEVPGAVAQPAQPELAAPGEVAGSVPAADGAPGQPLVGAEAVHPAEPAAPVAAAEQPGALTSARPRLVPVRAVAPRATRRTSPKPAAPSTKATEESAPSVIIEAQPAEAAPSGQLSEELALLSQVRSSVQAGTPNRALELLTSYEARFGKPIMGMEADALRVDALCRAGQRDAARASAQAFQNEWPGSPLGPRVSAACP